MPTPLKVSRVLVILNAQPVAWFAPDSRLHGSWKRKPKGSAFADATLSPNSAAMPVNDSLDTGEPNTGAFELVACVQPLEYSKELVGLFHVESHAIVPNKDHDLIFFNCGPNLDFRRPCPRLNLIALDRRFTIASRSMDGSA